jgi:hypothetical protein
MPASYEALARWFPSATARAQAIGVSREIVRRWESNLARTRPQVQGRTARTIRTIVALAREAERLVGDPLDAGQWILVRQPALRGTSVAEAARDGRFADVEALLAHKVGENGRSARVRRFTANEVRAGAREIQAGRGPASRRERPRDAEKAAVLRRIGVDESLIGEP